MATFNYTNNTFQLGIAHQNIVCALKIDPSGDPKVTLLDQAVAAADGSFSLSWEDWSGRILVVSMDNEGVTNELNCRANDFLTGTETALNYHIIIGVGDSNLIGYEVDSNYTSSPDAQDVTYANMLQLAMSGGTPSASTTLADDPLDWLNDVLTTRESVSTLTWFVRPSASANLATDVYIIVPAARFSNQIEAYDQSTGADYADILTAVANIQALHPTATVDDFVMNISTSQTATPAAFKTAIKDLITNLRTDLSAPNMRAHLLQTFPEQLYDVNGEGSADANWVPRWEGEQEIPLELDRVMTWSGKTLARQANDEHHYDDQAQRDMGTLLNTHHALADTLTTALPNVPVIADSGTGYVAITVPTTGAQRYNVEYRDAGSAGAFTSVVVYPRWGEQAPGETLYFAIPGIESSDKEVQVNAESRFGTSAFSSSITVVTENHAAYWRVFIDTTNGNDFPVCGQLQFRPVIGGPHRALEGTPIAGSEFSAAAAVEEVFKGYWGDGNWAGTSGSAGTTAWIGFQYDSPQYVREFVWGSRNDGATQASDQAPNDMRLQRSTDGVTWVDVLTVLDQTGWDDNGTERTFN